MRYIKVRVYFFCKQLRSGPSTQICLYFQNFPDSKLFNSCLVIWPNEQILRVFQWFFSIGHCTVLVKDRSSFYEIRCVATCMAYNRVLVRVNRKKLDILKTFLDNLEFYIIAYWRWFSPKICSTNYVPRASCL